MKLQYFDLVDQTFDWPQPEFKIENDALRFHGIPMMDVVERFGSPLRITYLPKIGGGIAGDFPICVVPMLHQDLGRDSVPLWGYFCQISDSTTSYGSYSGAVPNEKITWGKLGENTPKFIIESDATIVAPIVFAWILNW